MRKTSVKTCFLIKVLFLFIIQGLDLNSDDGYVTDWHDHLPVAAFWILSFL